MALATEWRTFGLPEDAIKGVCAISGVFDLEPIAGAISTKSSAWTQTRRAATARSIRRCMAVAR